MEVQVNKLFLEQLTEHRHGFRVLDVSSLESNMVIKPETDSGEDIEDEDDKDKKEDSRKKREKQRAANLTKYLQYVTASD